MDVSDIEDEDHGPPQTSRGPPPRRGPGHQRGPDPHGPQHNFHSSPPKYAPRPPGAPSHAQSMVNFLIFSCFYVRICSLTHLMAHALGLTFFINLKETALKIYAENIFI